jgi:hypothetical protein
MARNKDQQQPNTPNPEEIMEMINDDDALVKLILETTSDSINPYGNGIGVREGRQGRVLPIDTSADDSKDSPGSHAGRRSFEDKS